MKTLFIALFLMASVSCAWNAEPIPYKEKLPTDIVTNLLIDEYEVRYGVLPARCPEHLQNVVYVERGEKFIPGSNHVLGVKDGVSGQHYYDQISYIWISKRLNPIGYNAILVHELIHALLSCKTDPGGLGFLVADGDGDHNESDIWCTAGYGCKFNGKDNENSLEYAVSETVRYFSD